MKYKTKPKEVEILIWKDGNEEEIMNWLKEQGAEVRGIVSSGAGRSIDFRWTDGTYHAMFYHMYMLFEDGQRPKMVESRFVERYLEPII